MAENPSYEELLLKVQALEKELLAQKKNRASTRNSGLQIYKLIDFLPDATFAVDREGRVIVWNKAMEELTGVKSNEILGKGDYEYALPFYGARRPMLVDLIFIPNEEIESKYVYVRKTQDILIAEGSVELQGSRKYLWGKACPIYDDEGVIVGAIESVRDITEQKKAEQKISDSEERYRILAENVRDVIWVLDLDLKYTYISPSVKRLRGYSVPETMNQRLEEILTPESYKMAVEIFLQELEQERSGMPHDEFWSRTLEMEMVRKDGSFIWTEAIASFMRDEHGRVSHIIGVTRDITERKQTETALKESDDRFRKMADASPAVFWMVSPDRKRIIYASPAFEKVYGYTCETLYGQPSLWLEVIHPDDRGDVMHLASEDHAKVLDCEYRIIRSDGSVRWIHDRTSPIYNEKNEIILLTGIMEDITESKETEEERKIYETRVNRAQKMEAIGTLAGGIAHDFNNILSAIIGYTELALDDIAPTSVLHAYLEEVLKAGDRAKDLVRQILTFSRQVDIEQRPVKIHLIVKEALKLLRSSIPSTIKMIREIDPASGAVLADPTQVHQVIMNLCTNAYQAMSDKGGDLRVSLTPAHIDAEFSSLHPRLIEGPYIKLSVHDTGCGIGGTIIDRIFDPFFTTKDKSKGTGLGLATVHGIVMNLGGDITVSSTPGKGSAFDVYLPRFGVDIDEETFSQEATPTGNNEHILLVDDEEAILQFGKNMLEQLGYCVSITSASTTALEMFTRNPAQFDLVITDQTMPDMTGTQLVSRILKISPDIPIILTTGFSETISSQNAPSFGVSLFIEKPFNKSTIGKAIFEALHRQNNQA